MNMGKRVAERLKELGWLQKELLERVPELEAGNLSAMIKRDGVRSKWSEQIAAALGVRHAWLTSGTPPKEVSDTNPAAVAAESTVSDLDDAPRPARRVPIVGTARMGNDGYYEELGHPVGYGDGYVESASRDPNTYALRMKGDSMHPAIRHGWYVVVEPNSACSPGEYVVLQLLDGRKMAKELVRQTATEVVVESVNGGGRQTFDLSEVERMHPIVDIVPPSKWRPA